DLRGTVITNSPPHATALAEHPHLQVILIGGGLLKESLVTIGAGTVEAIRQIRADICFLGVCCVHHEAGITIPNLEESYVKRAMIAASAEVVALASTEKLETVATFAVAPLSELTHLVTESTAPEAVLQRYQQLGIKTMLV
ncbi:MAG TPA: DeoR family transcriptional regulator, partial [Acidobacteriota bacterium]|nr:DeoR family transcriptional regulator [Acidobacteriota bacterium]